MKTFKKLAMLLCIALITVSCCDCIEGNPQNLISQEEALILQDTFEFNQHRFINERLESDFSSSTPDNFEVSFEDLDDFQEYLVAVKNLAEDRNLTNPSIRLYFGARIVDGVPRSTVFFSGEGEEESEDPTDPAPSKMQLGIYYNKGNSGNTDIIGVNNPIVPPVGVGDNDKP